MKTYIKDFMNRYNYPTNAKNELINTYDKLANSQSYRSFTDCVKAYDQEEITDYNEIFAVFKNIVTKEELNQYSLNLLYLICISRHLKEMYEDLAWSSEIYDETMLDLKYKMIECYRLHRVWGNFVIDWEIGFFELKRVALGRVQFELSTFFAHYEKGNHHLEPGDKVVNIHIPSAGPLRAKDCEKSFEMAVSFFQKDFQGMEIPFVCSSWLLFPENKRMLPEKSNIVQFMKWFDIFATSEDPNGEELWRIFNNSNIEEPSKLPRGTTLQRAYADWLNKGRTLGSGYGVCFSSQF